MEGNKDQLANNREAAWKHLEITERNLANKEFVKEEYQSTLNAYLGKGYLGKLSLEEKQSPESWYVPHFPIVGIDKTTAKVRIVFDCTARHSGVSLINVIHAGPKMQSELFDNLIRLRRNPVGIVCDIREMYLSTNRNGGEGPTLLQISLAQLCINADV